MRHFKIFMLVVGFLQVVSAIMGFTTGVSFYGHLSEVLMQVFQLGALLWFLLTLDDY